MKAFAHLLERLAFTAARNAKLRLLRHYLQSTPDPDRGWALAALTGDLKLRAVTPRLLRGLIAERVDEQLFALSYDFVGDMAETIALLWQGDGGDDVPLSEAVALLQDTGRAGLPAAIAAMLDRLGPSERLAFLKLATGNMRVGLSARMARIALAEMGEPDVADIEEIWHGLTAPYQPLFDWVEGGPRPAHAALAPFRPVMLSTPVDLDQLQGFDPGDYVAEWKWDGIRVQAVNDGGVRKLYSRTGEDVSGAFPDVIEALNFDGAVDGELLVRRGDDIAPFGDLQQRLNRKTVTKAMLDSHPAGLRVYDLLIWQGRDMRLLPHSERRAALQAVDFGSDRIDVSPLLPYATWDDLAALRADPPSPVIEGVMLKRSDSAYVGGRPRGPWFKWKRDPMIVDAVMLYAQRGHGKRSGFYSDFTFGLWDGDQLVPVGKAYFGFTDEELRDLDRFVRTNTTERFGPVRSVAPKLVLEVAFEGLNESARHKSGVAMRFPRISRIRWDKPASEADLLDTLRAMLP
ncbi:cisplatin damage response ATP-dependent DNA ligase [Paracoccus sp. 1_MG-2023]|uniref:cisplatin damage response ATP-dependent DNA ligase n=1 Tax=unclassified Paracoccus (in: a-proteobacteria) TaxID=2688777 RepID=UPI001C091A3B|nr:MULTISPECIES: cisplatin damage response ATP-dependent DNA ligase [unclassified Paracoccus (in: a-proteobacteria)]MBU2957279.1 cisplatin damage response ATP-dependent DNA ligase [Paracoccus sp. C2R09]MDO6669166.1 cisplatin damage response ATP-dependent DNA ligase [Paracoccus sp. 1_MG-2023]